MFRRLFGQSEPRAQLPWYCSTDASGVTISETAGATPLSAAAVTAFLSQLVDDGFATAIAQETVQIDWGSLFAAIRSPGYEGLPDALGLPREVHAVPRLVSRGSLADTDFSIALDCWDIEGLGQRYPQVVGGLLTTDGMTNLLTPQLWALCSAVFAFAHRDASERNHDAHRRAWSSIRRLALEANAQLDDFLHRSVVLTPDRLEIGLRKSAGIADDSVIEIQPSFSGAPQDWLERFDAYPNVPDCYNIPTTDGMIQVVVTPAVRTVLEEIKRLPLRRVAGSRAQGFVLNPYAALGPDATEVIDETQFEDARAAAGLRYERFTPQIERTPAGRITRIGLLIESAGTEGLVSAEAEWPDEKQLEDFLHKLEVAIERGFQLLGWNGYDLELDGDAARHLATLRAATQEKAQPVPLISYDDVHDLAGYSARILGIDIDGASYYKPYIAKKKDDGAWFPENIEALVGFTPEGETEPIVVPASQRGMEELREELEKAEIQGLDTVKVPWLPKPVSLPEARRLSKTFADVFERAAAGTLEPKNFAAPKGESVGKRKTLILRANITQIDYEERREALLTVPSSPKVPQGLRRGVSLLNHQLEGLAWLQHLHQSAESFDVRGALLADDMGLGKTFQILAFMAGLVEQNPEISPMLVVAPVSLLENWKAEADKFIRPGLLHLLTAYGESLAALRVPRDSIDARLKTEDGLVRFLKPGWVGQAKLVLTTYETLRDLEFSFSKERWSVMVCDEAQRIKNPAALVTQVAKKQKPDFRIACTGTPVENTLNDLWCLFDFIQPGLLGAFNDFGDRYRKPIEARNDEERTRIEELRTLIAPQILRRTKAEVAKDLPQKIEVKECKRLPLSIVQRNLYAKAISDFKQRGNPGAATPFKNHLGLLHYLRLICTDPRRHGMTVFTPEPIGDYRAKSPKLDWLLKQLGKIKAAEEKAIVFCEFRNIQRLLQYYIEEALSVRADIINGDTSASSTSADSRQKRIAAFQQKPGFGVIILSPVAVGFGVNIQAANHVIHYTRTWNPAKEDQATDRAYRIGQTKDVYVYFPVVTAGDFLTFDVKLDQLLEKKKVLAADILNGSGDLSPGEFDVGEIVPGGRDEELERPIDIEMALQMDGLFFEGLAAALWANLGHEVAYRTPHTNDHGVDVVALSGSDGALIQTKTSGNHGARLGWDAVKEVVGGAAFYEHKHPGVRFKKVGLTNQYFNDTAKEQAALNDVQLIEQSGLAELLNRHPTTLLQVERILYTDWGR